MIRRERKGERVRVTFALPKEEPTGLVSVVGDFNDWTPDTHRLTRRTNGTRSVAVEVPAGAELEFRYLGARRALVRRPRRRRPAPAQRRHPLRMTSGRARVR